MGQCSSTVVNKTHKKICVLTFNERDRDLRQYTKMYVINPDTKIKVEASGWSSIYVCVVSNSKNDGNILLYQRWKCRNRSVLTITQIVGVNVYTEGNRDTIRLNRGSICVPDEVMFKKACEALFYMARQPSSKRLYASSEAGAESSVKLLLIGDCEVGKSWLLSRLITQRSHMNTDLGHHVEGNDFKEIMREVNKNRLLLQIWDTSGQERYRSITTKYYSGSDGIMVVFDITDRKTFASCRYWLSQIQMYAGSNSAKILIGNKCDSPYRDIEVSTEEANNLAQEYDMAYIETSAKANINVNKAFDSIAELAYSTRAPPLANITMSQSKDHDHFFKVVILGNSGVGKSSIRERYSKDIFNLNIDATVEAECYLKNCDINNQSIKAQIWDIGGTMDKKRSSFYRGAAGAVVVFDVTKSESFASLGKLITDLRDYTDPTVVIVIIGNKCDANPREVSADIAMNYAIANGALYVETSAATGARVHDAFHNLFNEMIKVANDYDQEILRTKLVQRPETPSETSSVYFTAPRMLPYVCGYQKSGSVIVKNRYKSSKARSVWSDARSDYSDEGILRYDSR